MPLSIGFLVKALLVLSMVYALSLPSSAQTGSKRGERFLSQFGGRSAAEHSYIRLQQPGNDTDLTIDGVSWDDDSLASPFYYGARYTEFDGKSPWLGYAIEFLHFKALANRGGTVHATGTENGQPVDRDQPLSDSIQSLPIANGVNYLTINVVLRTTSHIGRRFSDSRFRGYVGLGMGPMIPHPLVTIGGQNRACYQYVGFGWQVFGGVDYMLSDDWSIFLEGKYTNDSFKFDVPEGRARTRLSVRHVVFGVKYRL